MPYVFLPAVLSGLLLWAAFFPLNLGFLGFVALVPWLSLVRAEVPRRRRYLAAYLGGVVFFTLATKWVRVAHPMMYFSWLGFAVFMPLTWVLALDLIRRLDRLGLPLAFSVPAAWVALEYARMHFPTGFPFLEPLGLRHMIGFGWYFLGYTQHDFRWLLQLADLGGVYAVSCVVGMVNGLVADWAYRPRPSPSAPAPRRPRPVVATALVPALFAAALGYGLVRLRHEDFTPGPRVAALQGSIPQDEKNSKGQSLAKTYGTLHLKAVEGPHPPDLVVWPETCFPDDWLEVAPGQTPSPEFARAAERRRALFAALRWGAPTLAGLNLVEWDGGRLWKYNTALLLGTNGYPRGRYDKMHLVPFGEYVPLGNVFPFLSVFTPYSHDYACRPGERWTRFEVVPRDGIRYTFACLICYEDSDPSLARRYVEPRAGNRVEDEPVDFFVNISNDGWFDGTEEHEQHLAICRFRAVETRRSVVRAVNMGISTVIDPDGGVVALPGKSWAESVKVEGVVEAVVPVDDRQTLFAALGDWVPGACWLAAAVGLVAGRSRPRSVT